MSPTDVSKTEQTREKIPGIIGGMGPEATVDLLQRIIANTPALDDVDHIRCIVDNNPKIPSRIKAILGEDGANPGPAMAEMARRLEQWGADFLAIPCNTAHYYYDWVAEAVSIPVIHLIDLVVEKIIAENPGLGEVGILGSTTIVKTGLYASRFGTRGIAVVYPEAADQEQLFALIRAVKKGDTGPAVAASFAEICSGLARRGVAVCILGCTELGVIRTDLPIASVDAAEVLAREIVAVVKQGKEPCTARS
jgi:aspartate racemase